MLVGTIKILIFKIIGILSIIIEGIRKVGGIEVVWERAYQTERIEFFEYNLFVYE